MSTFADALRKIEDCERREAEVPSAEVVELLASLNKDGGDVLPTDFGKLVEFAGDQAARWHARWQFSPAASPDEHAETEATTWNRLWEQWTDDLCAKVPDVRDSIVRTHKLTFLQRSLEKRERGLRDHRAMEVIVGLVSQLAIVLGRIGLAFIAHPLYTWSLYPPGTVGRQGGAVSRVVLKKVCDS